MPQGFSPANNVAEMLQTILARKKAEQQQAFLNDLTTKDKESEAKLREAQGGYYGDLGYDAYNRANQARAEKLPTGTTRESITDPNFRGYLEGQGGFAPGASATPSVSTSESFSDTGGNPVLPEDVPSSPIPTMGGAAATGPTPVAKRDAPLVYRGNQDDILREENKRAVGSLLANPNSIPADPLQRNILFNSLGLQQGMDKDVVTPGHLWSHGPTGGFTQGPQIYGPDAVAQADESIWNKSEASAAATARHRPPNWSAPIVGTDPKTGLPQNYLMDTNAANPMAPGSVMPTTMGAPAIPPAMDSGDINKFQLAQSAVTAASGPTFMGFGGPGTPDPSQVAARDIYANQLLARDTPAVQDIMGRVLTGKYQPPPLPNQNVMSPEFLAKVTPNPQADLPLDFARKIAYREQGHIPLTEADVRRIATLKAIMNPAVSPTEQAPTTNGGNLYGK